jgi:choline dehydrogenase-like flavoprotein
MTVYAHEDRDVVVIVGSGAGGGTLAHELCRAGVPVVVLEAGAHHRPTDFIEDEWASFEQLAWRDHRTTSGSWRVARDFPDLPAWTCKAVGGTTVHWAGCCPRLQPWELRLRSEHGDGRGANLLDWPLTLDDLEPYYDLAEDRMGVTRTNGIPPLPHNNNFKIMWNGATRAGYEDVSTGRMAINPLPRDGRPTTCQDGFAFQGDRRGAHWSTLCAELPKAQRTGRLDLRPESHAFRIEHGRDGRVDAVRYLDRDGDEQVQRARVVCVACNAIETARLLLLSDSPSHPDGLANSSGQVGRNYLRHVTGSVFSEFERPVHMYRDETMAGIVGDEACNDPGRGFVGGYYQLLSLGVPFLAAFLDPGAWGPELTAKLQAYERLAGMWIVGDDLPQESNRVTLNPDEHDDWGLPVPDVHYDDHANDAAMRDHAYAQASAVHEAAGATRVHTVVPYPATHNLGTARMSERPRDGVVDRWGRAHDVPNLFVSDGSVMTTGGAANPTLTIVALAIRQGEHIAREIAAGAL